MPIDWEMMFDAYGEKRVAKTDKGKHAYLPNAAQRAVLHAAGIIPSEGGGNGGPEMELKVLLDPEVRILNATYYKSLRGKKRVPEARMGRDFVSWINEGDRILIGHIGNEIFVAKMSSGLEMAQAADDISKLVNRAEIFRKAKLASGRPEKKERRVKDYVRSPFVVAAALIRAGGICERPKCSHVLFERTSGSPYLEVHHILPLSDGGEDSLINVAALCPACHREHHYGAEAVMKRTQLAAHIAALLVPS